MIMSPEAALQAILLTFLDSPLQPGVVTLLFDLLAQ